MSTAMLEHHLHVADDVVIAVDDVVDDVVIVVDNVVDDVVESVDDVVDDLGVRLPHRVRYRHQAVE